MEFTDTILCTALSGMSAFWRPTELIRLRRVRTQPQRPKRRESLPLLARSASGLLLATLLLQRKTTRLKLARRPRNAARRLLRRRLRLRRSLLMWRMSKISRRSRTPTPMLRRSPVRVCQHHHHHHHHHNHTHLDHHSPKHPTRVC